MIKISGLSYEQTSKLIPPDTILLGYVGSTAYGLATPLSDIDIRGVAVGPLSSYLGLDTFEQQSVTFEKYDSVVFELRKFVRLACGANPNVLELLFLDENLYIHRTSLGDELIKNRDWFLTKKAYHTFTGYARGQLYKIDHNAPTGDMGEKRKQLVLTHGFDTKNAAHCIRLLNTALELFTEGELYVNRAKRDGRLLQDIKAGVYSLEWIKAKAESLLALTTEAYVKSDLPKDVPYENVNNWLCYAVLKQHGRWK